jgi:hypothetical protein
MQFSSLIKSVALVAYRVQSASAACTFLHYIYTPVLAFSNIHFTTSVCKSPSVTPILVPLYVLFAKTGQYTLFFKKCSGYSPREDARNTYNCSYQNGTISQFKDVEKFG